MAFWYDMKDKKYAENERKSWLRAYLEKLVSNLRTEQNTKFSSHTTGDAYRHSAGDVDCSNSKTVQEVLDSYANQVSSLSQTVSGKVDKATGKGLSANDYTDSDKAEVAKIKNKVDNVEGKGLSTNDFTKDYKGKLDALNQNLSNKASCSSVLMTIVPNDPFTPKTDYHPATKKYVDDSVANKVDKAEGKGLSTNDFTNNYKGKLDALNQNLSNKASCSSVLMTIVPNEPFTPKTDYHPATKKYVDDSVASKVDKAEGKGLSTNDFTNNYKSKLDALNQNLSNKASCSSVLMTIVPNDPFTPTSDYHPATKKYVDDSVSALRTELLALINKS